MNAANNTTYSPSDLRDYVNPLLDRINGLIGNWPVIVGVAGGLGTGKSTLSTFLKSSLRDMGYAAESFSIDDFITSYEHRRGLAEQLKGNPFYQIYRAMPGTHRVDDLRQTLESIRAGRDFELPIFDKSLKKGWGDISEETRKVKGKQDVVLFEGWLVGTPNITSGEFQESCRKNSVDLKVLDPQLKHHQALISNLREYQQLWNFIDYLVMLQPESNELHHQWRNQAEVIKAKEATRPKEEVYRYVDVFMPLVCAGYEYAKPDVLFKLNAEHKFIEKKEFSKAD